MGLTIQDLQGTDLTGVDPITAGDLNNLVTLTVPKLDSNGDGKGLILMTNDTALGFPSVPDANVNTKWQRYLWIRLPFPGQNNNIPILYAWNSNATPDLTYLRWVQLVIDFTTFQAQIDDATNTANNALAQSNVALVTANTANSTANSANSAVSGAVTAANNAANAAAQASADASTAIEAANTATATATAAQTAANAKRDITAALNPGTAGQKIRTNAGATAVEWFNDINQYVKLSDTRAKGIASDATTNDVWATRVVNTEDSDTGGLVSIAANKITFAVPGIYRVHIVCPASECGYHKAALIDADANAVVLMGLTKHASGGAGPTGSDSIINGIITVTNTVLNFYIKHLTDVNTGKFGTTPTNVQYNGVDAPEVYLTAEFWKIN